MKSIFLLLQLDTSRLKYLRIWNEYAVTKRIQEERKMLADDHCRLSRLKGGFQKWKKKVHQDKLFRLMEFPNFCNPC